MELVQAFNAELSTLYESKPPISKGKMNTITKTAIKAIKMYKHIVQSVERFIAKCRPEYKVPGLYVIDSIVRQSRHQFGYDKDVFGPRFTRNFNQTFQNLFLACPVEDKPKIVRVLNLWQRNNVFSCDVIQPLLDMANPNAELKSNTPIDEQASLKDTQDKNIVMQLHQLASSLGISKNANGSNLNTSSSNNNDNQIHRFNKKLLEFDYGDDDEDDTPTESELPLSTTLNAITNSDELNANPLALSMAQNLLSNPDLVQKLQQSITMQSESGSGIGKMVIDNLDIASSSFLNLNNANNLNTDLSVVEQLFNLRDSLKLVSGQSASSNNNQFNQLNSKLEKRDYENKQDLKRRSVSPRKYGSSSKQHGSRESSRRDDRNREYRDRTDKRLDRRTERRNSRERRHRSRSPRSNTKKDLSNSFNNLQQVSTTSQLSPESKEKERERERRKKGVPSIKKNYVTICSTTLWLGHLPKSTTEIDISDAFGEYGDINSIDLISARGCAYVCMNRRQDAYKALQNLKNLKLHNSHIKMAWAPGLGMKGKEFKDYWDGELGVSYIPCEKLTRDTDFELLEDGGMLDEESIPKSLMDLRNEKLKEDKQQQQKNQTTAPNEQSVTSSVEMVQPPIPPSKKMPEPRQPPPPQILSIPPTIPPPIVPIGHTLPPFPIGPIGLPPIPPIPHHLMAPPIPLINHPRQNAPPHPILPPPMHQPPLVQQPPPQAGDQSNLKLTSDLTNEPLRTPNKQPPKNLFPQPPISSNSQLPPPNSPWITGVPPPTLQPPFLSKDEPPRNLGPPFFGAPPINNDDSFNNQMFEPNLMMNPNPMMMPFPHDDPQMQFNEMNKRDMFNNWRMKKDQRNNNRRFNNNMNNNYNNEGNYNDQWKRKNDNYNNGKKFKNNQNKKFNNNNNNKSWNDWNQRRSDQQGDREEAESDPHDNEMNESNDFKNDVSETSRNELSNTSNGQPVDQSNEAVVSDTQNNLSDNLLENLDQPTLREEIV